MGRMNFLKRRSRISKNFIIVDEKSSSQTLSTERKSSDTSLSDVKVALFYSEQPGKAKMTPIPTPPPSPPKAKAGAGRSAADSTSQPTTPSRTSFPLQVVLSPTSLPSPPCSPKRRGSGEAESALDRGSRLSGSGQEPPQTPTSSITSSLESTRLSFSLKDDSTTSSKWRRVCSVALQGDSCGRVGCIARSRATQARVHACNDVLHEFRTCSRQ